MDTPQKTPQNDGNSLWVSRHPIITVLIVLFLIVSVNLLCGYVPESEADKIDKMEKELEALIEKCINGDAEACNTKEDFIGNTPLLFATAEGDIETVKMLLEKGADIHATNNDGNTVLHIAALNRKYKLLEIFYDWNRDEVFKIRKIQNKDGNTALHLCYLNYVMDYNIDMTENVNNIRNTCCLKDVLGCLFGGFLEYRNKDNKTPDDIWKEIFLKYQKKNQCHISKWQTVDAQSRDQFYIRNIDGFNMVIVPWYGCSTFRHNLESVQTAVELRGAFPTDMQYQLSESLLQCYRKSLYPAMGDTALSDLAKECNGEWF